MKKNIFLTMKNLVLTIICLVVLAVVAITTSIINNTQEDPLLKANLAALAQGLPNGSACEFDSQCASGLCINGICVHVIEGAEVNCHADWMYFRDNMCWKNITDYPYPCKWDGDPKVFCRP